MNVFFHELKSYRKPALIWAISLSVLAVVFLVMYPSFTKDVAASQKVLANLPPALRDALGISLNNFFTIFGFYSYFLTYLTLAGALQAMNLGVGIISKETSGKTADFLLTKPASRASVLTGKLLAAAGILAVTNAVFIPVSILAARIVATGAFSLKTFFFISLTVPLVQVFFLVLGAVFAVIIPNIRSVISVTLPTVFAFFIVGALGAIIGNQNVRYITPFKFYDTNYIIGHGALEPKFIVFEAVLVALALTASYLIFIKKDIRAAA